MARQAWYLAGARLLAVSGLLNSATAVPALDNSSLCSNLPAPTVPGAQVLSIWGTNVYDASFPPLPPFFLDTVTGLNVCNVTVYLTHPGIDDKVVVQLFLPLAGWNGRFQATGGGGLATSFGEVMLSRGAANQYATARTDGGHVDDFYHATSWALLPNGSVNWGLLENFASRSLHDMAVVGKAVTESYYGKKPSYSYWNGCSTGGRSGIAEAQIYPEDFDGIVAASPSVNTPSVYMGNQWPQVVMTQEGYYPSPCEFQAFLVATIEKCDGLDGVVDGVISNLEACHFDAYSLVGTKVNCSGVDISITEKTATIVHKIRQGPQSASGSRLWWGLNAATDFQATALTVPYNGTNIGSPFTVSNDWISLFLEQNPNFNTTTITYSKFRDLFAQSNAEYDDILAINNPNLSPFRAAGGKMITWQGLADDLVFSQGTLNYYQQVEKVVGKDQTADFYRLFLVPGGGHCYGIEGPIPNDALVQLVDWVEKGIAPETLPAEFVNPSGVTVSKNLCRYPYVSKYNGKGNIYSADSYTCATSF